MEEPVILRQNQKSKLHPLLEMLPLYLKEPKNYLSIRKAIYETMATTCAHDSIAKMAECKKCSRNMMERRLLLKKLGFKNPQQYQAWQKIMEEIMRLYPEQMFNTERKYIKT